MTGKCTECGEPCEVIVVDFGIGAYEYWGATGYDSRPEAVSNCCEAPVRGENRKEITLEDLGQYNFDPPDQD
jgi:hypothetical protein